MTADRPLRFSARDRRILPLGLLLCAAVISFFFLQDDQDLRRDLKLRKSHSFIEGLTITHKSGNTEAWAVTAKRADLPKEGDVATLYDVAVQVKKDGLTVTADEGTYNMNSKDVTLRNNIRAHLKGSVLSTGSLSWSASSKTLSSPDLIKVESSKFRLEGEGLSATSDNKIRLQHNVKGTFF